MAQTRTQKVKHRLCWNCEGNAPVTEKNCPYCGVYLGASEETDLAPPYKPEATAKEKGIPDPIYQSESEQQPPEKVEDEKSSPSALICTLLLSTGVILFLFGLVLLIFAQEGRLTLQWNANYWYLYLLLSIPLLAFAWHTLHQLEEGHE